MKTGIELITKERQEQIAKHGRSVEHDDQYKVRELSTAAVALLNQHPAIADFPPSWRSNAITHHMASKPYSDRLIIAGALIAAEIDRLQRMS